MFDSNFQFEEKTYRIPKMTRIEDVFEYIDTIPNYDSGKIFGLNPLANDRFIRRNHNKSNRIKYLFFFNLDIKKIQRKKFLIQY
jgi:hypothetical protein